MGPIVVATIAAFVAAAGVALYRLKRGWETWGDLAQMALSLAVIGGVLSALDNSIQDGLFGAAAWGLGGTWAYWLEKPANPVERPALEPQTEVQRKLVRRLELTMSIGMTVIAIAAIGAVALHLSGRATFAGWAVLSTAVIVPVVLAWRVSKALRESGPPYDRLPRRPRPTRW
jgi:hypothetical protein